MLHQRASGLLLHISSLAAQYGVGDLGPEAFAFADFLAEAGQTYWQLLPLTPVDAGSAYSPYGSPSAFAGNPLLISLERLADDGLLEMDDCQQLPDFMRDMLDLLPYRTHWDLVRTYKEPLLEQAAQRFRQQASPDQRTQYGYFCAHHAYWLDNYVLFVALQEHTGKPVWTTWPDKLARRDKDELAKAEDQLRERLETLKIIQYFFYQQWQDLSDYCWQKRIRLIGDCPLYIHHNSADVWTHPDLFKLDKYGHPTHLAGVTSEPNRWPNMPAFAWCRHIETDFEWWCARLKHQFSLFGLVRLNQFSGLAADWQIPIAKHTSDHEEWVRGPIDAFLNHMYRQFGNLSLLADDIGSRTSDVQPYLRQYSIPGMRLLQHGFGNDMGSCTHSPHNYVENCIAYTSTQDTNTVRGWFQEADQPTKKNLNAYLGTTATAETIAPHLCRIATQSVARLVVLPVQDVLNLDESARLHTPGDLAENWSWRLKPGQLTTKIADDLQALTLMTGRL